MELVGIDRGHQHRMIMMAVCPAAWNDGDAMAHHAEYGSDDIIRFICNDMQAGYLVSFVHGIDDFFRYILEDDGIQRLVPAVQPACCHEHECVDGEDIVPDRSVQTLRQIDGDEIRTAAGRIGTQRHGYREPADQTAEHTDQKGIRCDRGKVQYGCKEGCHGEPDQGIQDEFMPDPFPDDHCRCDIQSEIDHAEADMDAGIIRQNHG